MKLSEIIRNYRYDNDMSQREFAKRCGLSNSYISFIEKELNPKTGKPLVPTIEQYGNIARGMGITLQRLFEMLDKDSPVSLAVYSHSRNEEPPDNQPLTNEARIISGGVDKMPPEKREQALKILQVAFTEYADFFKEETDNDT